SVPERVRGHRRRSEAGRAGTTESFRRPSGRVGHALPLSSALRGVPARAFGTGGARQGGRAARASRAPPRANRRRRPGGTALPARWRLRGCRAGDSAVSRRTPHGPEGLPVTRSRPPIAGGSGRVAAVAAAHGRVVLPLHRRLRAGAHMVAPG